MLRNKDTLPSNIPEGTWAVEKSLPSPLSRGSRLEETHCLVSAGAGGTHVKSVLHMSKKPSSFYAVFEITLRKSIDRSIKGIFSF